MIFSAFPKIGLLKIQWLEDRIWETFPHSNYMSAFNFPFKKYWASRNVELVSFASPKPITKSHQFRESKLSAKHPHRQLAIAQKYTTF